LYRGFTLSRGDKTGYQDDCLAQAEDRAGSPPIFVSFER